MNYCENLFQKVKAQANDQSNYSADFDKVTIDARLLNEMIGSYSVLMGEKRRQGTTRPTEEEIHDVALIIELSLARHGVKNEDMEGTLDDAANVFSVLGKI